MNKIQIKKLSLLNFKGVREQSIDFNQQTNIHGDNGTGKTTLFDAFTWLLFGKDSTDRKQFEIKTLDANNSVIPKIDHYVCAVLDINGQALTIKRLLREKWVKKRGALEAELTGNETIYYWNNLSLPAKEFQEKISSLVDEGIFKLITNPLYFNGLKWQDRREVLVKMAGDVSDQDVAEGKEEFSEMLAGLEGKTIQEHRRAIAARKKQLNDALKTIPTRIDEANRSLPEAQDFDALRMEVKAQETALQEVEGSLLNQSKALSKAQEEHAKTQKAVFECKSKIQQIEFAEKERLAELEAESQSYLNGLERELVQKTHESASGVKEMESQKYKIGTLEAKREALRQEWHEKNAEEVTFNEAEFSCPTCKRAFEASDIEAKQQTMSGNFQAHKKERLLAIQSEGKQLASEIEKATATFTQAEGERETIQKSIAELEAAIAREKANKTDTLAPETTLSNALFQHQAYNDLHKKLSKLSEKTTAPPAVDTSALEDRKAELREKINRLNASLSHEDMMKKTQQRIAELEGEEKDLAQRIAELEGSEFTVESFIKAKMEAIESRINGKFHLVKFKLFEQQLNGGEVECCEALVDGVPFSDLNTAARVNAGLDVINALTQFHQVSAPIFIDNSESINELIAVEAQLIRLIVSKDKSLKIN